MRSECQVVYTVALAVYKLKCREGNKCRGRETVLVGVDAYYLIGHSLYIDILSYRLGTWKQHLDSLFVQYDHLPAFLHVAVVDETSLFQFYSFQFRIVGKDALQRNGNVFLAEGEDGVALADAGSGGDDFIGKSFCGKLKIAFIQRESSAFFQSVERFRCISRINFD